MKKIPFKTIALILLILANVAVLILSSFSLMDNFSVLKTDISTIDEYKVEGLKKYYDVKRGDIVETKSIRGKIALSNQTYKTYILDIMDESISIFDDVIEGQLLGTNESTPIYCENYSKIMNVEKEGEKYLLTLFQYKEVFVNVTLSYSSYYSNDYANDNYSITIGNNKRDVVYLGVDFSNTEGSTVDVKFSIKDNDFLFGKDESVVLEKEINTYKNVYYIDDCSTLGELMEKNFYYTNTDGKVSEIKIFCEKVVSNHYIISSYDLKEGMRIYDNVN